MRLLAAVPGSVLWLLESSTGFRDSCAREAAARGIAPERLVFAPRVSPEPNLARQPLADLVLDTSPYNGHMTTSDALWAGVPLVTLAGQAFAGRVAASQLAAIGMDELITDNLDAYEALALKLAQDPALLKATREKLARNRNPTPLFDIPRWCRMWKRPSSPCTKRRGETDERLCRRDTGRRARQPPGPAGLSQGAAAHHLCAGRRRASAPACR